MYAIIVTIIAIGILAVGIWAIDKFDK